MSEVFTDNFRTFPLGFPAGYNHTRDYDFDSPPVPSVQVVNVPPPENRLRWSGWAYELMHRGVPFVNADPNPKRRVRVAIDETHQDSRAGVFMCCDGPRQHVYAAVDTFNNVVMINEDHGLIANPLASVTFGFPITVPVGLAIWEIELERVGNDAVARFYRVLDTNGNPSANGTPVLYHELNKPILMRVNGGSCGMFIAGRGVIDLHVVTFEGYVTGSKWKARPGKGRGFRVSRQFRGFSDVNGKKSS